MTNSIYDTLNFTKTLTRKRLVNVWKNYGSFRRAQKTKSPFHPGLPVSMSIEPTTSCNLRCPECPSGLRSFTRPTGMIAKDTFKKLLNELHLDLSYLMLYFQGEPYLNPDFLDLVNFADKQNIYTTTSTNAHFLDQETADKTVESGLSRIIVSIDGTEQASYEKYRIGGNLEKVINGIKNLVETKKRLKSHRPLIILQFLLFKHNTHQIPEVRKMARDLQADELEFKTAQVYNFKNGSDLIPDEEIFSRYKKNGNNQFHIKNDMINKCWKMWHSCVMTWDGDIVPCCFDKDAKYKMGNINNQRFAEIWNGSKYQEFRANLFSNRSVIDMCKNCTEGMKTKITNTLNTL